MNQKMDPEPNQPSDAAAAALRRATGGGKSKAKKSPTHKKAATYQGRDPQLLGPAVDDFLVERGWEHSSTAAVLLTNWADIAGADLASHVVPESFVDGELALRAESTSWATQVRLLLPNLRTVIDEAVGRGVVKNITVVGPNAPSWVAGPRRVKGRGPRDTYG
ncbi:MAG: DUF721 domain-containing protein [Candidatus Nanopelagicales bacterium]|nr:DUF721 domain-containing protein [Candidatus Nanopelagicales bacterium]